MILIVGGGIFGQVIAAKLRRDGHSVTVFDRREKEAGSLPSGGHVKRHWVDVSPRDFDAAVVTLNQLFGVEHLQCRYQYGNPMKVKSEELLRVDVERVLREPIVQANVTKVGNGWLEVGGERLEGTVIVAAGVWSKQLLPGSCGGLKAKKGVSFIFHGGDPVDNLIWLYAPYKQIVRASHGPNRTWIGDGTAILMENWNNRTEEKVFNHVLPFAPPNFTLHTRTRGLRPYMAEGLQQISSRLWLATGGGKSGTALAGVYANRLAAALR